MVGGGNLEESFDSDQSEDQDKDFEAKIKQYSTIPSRMERIETRIKLRQQITTQNQLQLHIQRGSIKQGPSQFQMGGGYSRQTSRMSVYEKRQTMIREKNHDELTVDEMTMIYYLVNLIFYKQHNVANSLIKKHYLEMKKCQDIFIANVRRLQALSLYSMFSQEIKNNRINAMSSEFQAEKYSRMSQIDRCLKRAEKRFRRAECPWGLGLTYFQQAYMFIYQMDLQPHHYDVSDNPSPLQRKNLSRSRQGGFNLIKLSDKAREYFERAAEEFKLVNHWRGLCNTYRQLEQLMNSIGAEH